MSMTEEQARELVSGIRTAFVCGEPSDAYILAEAALIEAHNEALEQAAVHLQATADSERQLAEKCAPGSEDAKLHMWSRAEYMIASNSIRSLKTEPGQ